jgi:protein-S-isoprenylcysteine O-methyltransferase Ste14
VAAPLALDNWVATTLVFAPPVALLLLEQRRFRGDRRRRAADRTSRRLEAWQIAGLALGIASAKALPDAALPGNGWLWVGVGCGISVAGIALRLWAIRTLGTHFTRYLRVADDQRVVVDGPYRRLRHPSYTGAIVIYTGVGIGLGNAVGLTALVLLPAIGFIERIPQEEALLGERFGDSYTGYARQTSRLIPGLW